mmetsp:Transcript_1765/g.2338  ORF Transcript_1765/g.2338 Transcript_1765/m.2338 type:complete len:304 (+) Transcript_1765:128-1039(+)
MLFHFFSNMSLVCALIIVTFREVSSFTPVNSRYHDVVKVKSFRRQTQTQIQVQGGDDAAFNDDGNDDEESNKNKINEKYGNFFDEILMSQQQPQPQPDDSDFFNPYDADADDEDDILSQLDLEEPLDDFVPKINTVTLVGRIGQQPEPKYFDDNQVVLRLSLAVKRKYHPLERLALDIRNGEEETDWFNLELWGRDAEYAGKYVTKGARVGITGSLNIDTWVDKMTGEERASPKIVVKHLDILETRAEAELRTQNTQQYRGGGGNQGGYSNRSNDYNSGNEEGSGGYGDEPSSAGSGGFFDNY